MKVTKKQKEMLEKANLKRVDLYVRLSSGKQFNLQNFDDLLAHIDDIKSINISYEKKGDSSIYGYGIAYPHND